MSKYNENESKKTRRFLNKRNVIRLIGMVVVIGFAGLAIQNIYSLNGQVKLKENKLNNLNIELNTVNDQLKSLQSDLDKSKDSDSAKQERIKQLEAEKATLENEKTTLENEKSDLKTQLQAKLAEKEKLARAATLSSSASAKSSSSSSKVATNTTCYNWMSVAGIADNELDAAYKLIMKESGCNPYARNPNSGAYGIPQSLPGNKMAKYGSDWQSNPITQLKWMNEYVHNRYGSFQRALDFHYKNNWY